MMDNFNRTCPTCGGSNIRFSATARDEAGRLIPVCGHCLTAVPTETPEPRRANFLCPRCGAHSEPDSSYCHACGLPLDEIYQHQSGTVISASIGRPAGFWIRLVAWFIDFLLITVVQFVLIGITPDVSLDDVIDAEGFGTGTWVDAASFFIAMTYYTVGLSVWATTIGKKAMGIYVLRPDGSKLGLGRAFARYWAHSLSALTLGIGFLMIAFRRDKRSLHDLICETVVVHR